jgi:hypothetical protein
MNTWKKHLHNLVLRLSLFVRHSLDVGVHRDLEIGMTQEFLNDFGVLSIGIQDRPRRMVEGVPADTLSKPILSAARFSAYFRRVLNAPPQASTLVKHGVDRLVLPWALARRRQNSRWRF